MYPDFNNKGNKKYITKGPKPKEEEKPAAKPVKVEKQPEVKPKAEEKQEDPESLHSYKF